MCKLANHFHGSGEERVLNRVARWYGFEPKIQVWVTFGGPWNEKSWYVYSIAIWKISQPYCIFYGQLAI
jgi:hypothetical protein